MEKSEDIKFNTLKIINLLETINQTYDQEMITGNYTNYELWLDNEKAIAYGKALLAQINRRAN